jgi:hypothetical protein
MKRHVAALVAIWVGLGAGAVRADTSTNRLYIVGPDDPANAAAVTAIGSYNAVSVDQTHSGRADANTLDIRITGDFNKGGPITPAFGPELAGVHLQPGQMVQSGYGNAMNVTVAGNANLFAFSQVGSANALTAMITGNNNQAAVAQFGSGNSLSFVQNGNGNVLSVIQRSP